MSKDTISKITDRVIAEMAEWSARPLEKVYAAIFIDAIQVKVRDGQVGNRPNNPESRPAIGVDLAGHRRDRWDVLGLWAGSGGGESAKFWMSALAELKNRGVADVFFVVCDGLKGLPDSVVDGERPVLEPVEHAGEPAVVPFGGGGQRCVGFDVGGLPRQPQRGELLDDLWVFGPAVGDAPDEWVELGDSSTTCTHHCQAFR